MLLLQLRSMFDVPFSYVVGTLTLIIRASIRNNGVAVGFGTVGDYTSQRRRRGNLAGFDGTNVLAKARENKYMKDTWFMHTVMGGFKEIDVTIKKVTATEIIIKYTVHDHFGAGTDDAQSKLPGLPSLYWLQHNSTDNNVTFKNCIRHSSGA